MRKTALQLAEAKKRESLDLASLAGSSGFLPRGKGPPLRQRRLYGGLEEEVPMRSPTTYTTEPRRDAPLDVADSPEVLMSQRLRRRVEPREFVGVADSRRAMMGAGAGATDLEKRLDRYRKDIEDAAAEGMRQKGIQNKAQADMEELQKQRQADQFAEESRARSQARVDNVKSMFTAPLRAAQKALTPTAKPAKPVRKSMDISEINYQKHWFMHNYHLDPAEALKKVMFDAGEVDGATERLFNELIVNESRMVAEREAQSSEDSWGEGDPYSRNLQNTEDYFDHDDQGGGGKSGYYD